jgi:hypothetical protein
MKKIDFKKFTLIPVSIESKKYQCQNTGCGKVYSSFGQFKCKIGGYCVLHEVS